MTTEQKIIRAKVGLLELGQAAWQRQPGLQDDGLYRVTVDDGGMVQDLDGKRPRVAPWFLRLHVLRQNLRHGEIARWPVS